MSEVSSLSFVKRTLAHRTVSKPRIMDGLYGKTTQLELGKNEYGNRVYYELELEITSWHNRDPEVIIELNKHKIDICALSELKRQGKGNIKY